MEWFEKRGFFENPFSTEPTTELIGFNEISEELHYRVASGSMVFLEGKDGSGKTSLLKQLIQRFRGFGKVIYVSLKKDKGCDIKKIMQKRYGFFGTLFNITSKDMILFLDDVERISKRNANLIKYYFDHGYIMSVVFCSEDYKKARLPKGIKKRIGKRVLKIKRLTNDEALQVFRSRIDDKLLSDSLVKELYKKSSSTKDFLEKCDKLYDYITTNNIKNVTEKTLRMVK